MALFKNRFSDYKISHKLFVVFQVMSIFLILVSSVFMFFTYRLHTIAVAVIQDNAGSIQAAYKVEVAILNLKGLKANYLLDGDERWLEAFDDYLEEFNKWYNLSFQLAKTEKERELLSELSIKFEEYMEYHRKIIRLYKEKKIEQAKAILLEETMETFNVVYEGCEKIIQLNEQLILSAQENGLKYLRYARMFAYPAMAAFIILGLMLTVFLSKSIVGPIIEMERSSEELMEDSQPSGHGNEVRRLQVRFQHMIETVKKTQEKMFRIEKQAAIGELAAGLSHELNNPIGVIFGYAERLQKKEKLTESQERMVKMIYQEAHRCKNILGDVLNFARPQQGKHAPVEITALIDEVVHWTKAQDKYQHIDVKWTNPLRKYSIVADAVQLQQVLVNLIINAADAMNENGKIFVQVKKEKKAIKINVTDNGPGIDPAILGNIFKPFYSTKAKGTGLGLAISQMIIEKHEGNITVESEPGKTVFTISLPAGNLT